MKLFFKILLGGCVVFSTLALLGVGGAFWWSYNEFVKSGPSAKTSIIIVKRGSNIGGVADNLGYLNIIEYPYIFRLSGRITGQASKIKAGEYEVPAGASMKDILDILEEGKTMQRSVTLREGLTSFEIMHILGKSKDLKQVDIKLPAEGSLLPETYSYSKGESNIDIIRRMESAMAKTIDELWKDRAEGLPIKTKEEAMILASIIEKETAMANERARVAGVFINRLRKGMMLQTDPTVIYALTGGAHDNNGKGPLGRRLLRKDLAFDSPYNTYKYAGLPPGPIANPGRASIAAALNPEQHDYIYFVADGSGGHAFGKTLADHNRNVSKWRKIRKSQNNK